MQGHQAVYRRRPDSYRSEYPVEYRHDDGGVPLRLRGRADGYDPVAGVVEEIKTCRVQAGGSSAPMWLAAMISPPSNGTLSRSWTRTPKIRRARTS